MDMARNVAFWAFSSALVIAVLTLPVSMQTQLVLSFTIIVLITVLKITAPEGKWRLVTLALGTSIVIRYVFWRTTETIPPISQLENFIPGFLVYLAEMYSVMMLGLSLFIVALPLPNRQEHSLDRKALPRVDVFVPSYNEDHDLLANTLAAAKALDYPEDRLQIWLLDDGGTLQKQHSHDVREAETAIARSRALSQLCEMLGVNYLTRERNEHAKAGNLNNGLAHSTGELIAVFDADHAPARNFLLETVGHFQDDPKLFLVQTPHFFINPDPLERNLQTFEKMPSENEMFYGIIQKGLDRWNAAFFCGSAAVLSRAALQESNGFNGVSITEDCETAIVLHSAGWNSIYVDKPLIAGLQPATFASFIAQRSRWAQGMMQILRFKAPLLRRGLSLPQRLCYMSSTLFWLFPFTRITFLLAPLAYLFFGLEIFTSSGGEFLAYTSAYMLVNMMLQNYLYGSFRWPWISELYEYIQTVHLLPAVVSVMLNPRKPTFKVTAKDETVSADHVSELGRPFFVIFAVLVSAFIVTIYRIYTEPYNADVILVVGGWNLLNIIIAGCALGVVSERRDRASSRRFRVRRRCELGFEGQWYPASIEDVSVGGMRLQAYGKDLGTLTHDSAVEIRFKPHGGEDMAHLSLLVRSVQSSGEMATLGCKYMPTNARDHRWIADLIFANSSQWEQFQRGRRKNPGLLRGSIWFLGLALYQTSRGLSYFIRSIRGRPA
ncbi:cellulose synthase (UDP-forming) [Rhizobium sp. RU35A]|uniref:UDP-forming cellulose synthase catalytic subunit n=1 Tax=Rhizobium sp. RU35A TaxID=1907414 RepID=UPI000953E5FC|nr:UDP-forming cellulose synthase catalytic subunit [Rhizobium sp. RU35A]SIQ90295.1 cellulose synthase (UDP-forming) [Rhizobium sp. RU35A]